MGSMITEKILRKKVGELTVAEFIDYFPILNKGRKYRSKKTDIIEHKILNNANGNTIWDISKKINVDYDTVRLKVKEFEKKELLIITKEKNEKNRIISRVSRTRKRVGEKNE